MSITNPLPAASIAEVLRGDSYKLIQYLSEEIYCKFDPEYIRSTRERLARTADAHVANVGNKPSWLLRAPGRLNAFLEYLDMCDGDHMSTTIDGDLPVCVSVREDDVVRVFNVAPNFKGDEFSIADEMQLFKSGEWMKEAVGDMEDNWDNRTRVYPYYGHKQGDWLNYVRSSWLRVAWELPETQLRGVDITFGESSIPMRGGTSSSSALVVLSFLALYVANVDRLPKWSVQQVCKLLGEAEWYVGTHGGANDQTTILRNQPNSVLYNRHSQPELDSTVLPFLKGVKFVVANSLWEANKTLGANHVFNLRKGWMDIGDDLMKLIIATVCDHIDFSKSTEPGWVCRLLNRLPGFKLERCPYSLEEDPELWKTIRRNYAKFGSLDESILGVNDEVIEELVDLLPVEIMVEQASKLLGKGPEELERMYTLPYPSEGGYRPRSAARFFHKENRLGRELERLFLDANEKLESGELSVSSTAYEAYQARVGEILEELQTTLREDFQVSNYQLDLLLNIASFGPGYVGGKLTGAGSGGCVVVMVREGAEELFCDYLDKEYYAKPENFSVYRERLSELENADIAKEMITNLDSALANSAAHRRVVTFSAGARVLEIPK